MTKLELSKKNKYPTLNSVELFLILFLLILPILSLPIKEIFSLGTIFYFISSLYFLLIIKFCKNIFNLKLIYKLISKLCNEKFDKVVLLLNFFFLSTTIIVKIKYLIGTGYSPLSTDIILRLRELATVKRIELNPVLRLASVFAYITSFNTLLIAVRKIISENKISFIYSLPWILLSILNASRNQLIYIISIFILIKIKDIGKTIKTFLLNFKISKKSISTFLGFFILTVLVFLLNFARTFLHESNLSMYQEWRDEVCIKPFKNLQGESRIDCKKKGYDGIVPLSLNPYYLSHGLINLNILFESSEISLIKTNAIDNFLNPFTARFVPKKFFDINKFSGHGLGGSTLFGELTKRFGLLFTYVLPLSILYFDKLLKTKIPNIFKLYIINNIYINLIYMPFWFSSTSLVGQVVNSSLIILPFFYFIISKINQLLKN